MSTTQLWISSYNFRPIWAGPAERFMRYAPELRQRGVETTFVTVLHPGQLHKEIVDDTPVVRLGGADGQILAHDDFTTQAILYALQAEIKPDVLLFLSIAPRHIPLLWRLKRTGIRTIYVSTMALINRQVDTDARSQLRRFCVNLALSALYRSIDQIVSSTSYLMQDFIDLRVPQKRLSIIPNGVSLSRFVLLSHEDEVRTVRQRLKLPLDEPIVLYVGLMLPRKGVLELIEAWQQYRRNGGKGWLVMVGQELRQEPEFSAFYQQWDQCLSQLQESDQVIRHPPAGHIEEYFQAADLFVFLSDLEGMPNVLLESMASGLPVLTNRFRGFSADFGQDGSELVITTREPNKISRTLQCLMDDPERRQQLGHNARKWIEVHHDLQRSLDQYAALCHQNL